MRSVPCAECGLPAEVLSEAAARERFPELDAAYAPEGSVVACTSPRGCGRVAPYAVVPVVSAADFFRALGE